MIPASVLKKSLEFETLRLECKRLNGFIWELTEDGEQGEKVGYFKKGEPFFYAEEN